MRYFHNVNTYFAIFSKYTKEGLLMSIKDRIKELCSINNVSVNKLEKTLGFATGYVSKLDKSTPNTSKINMIADYFNVTVDYLMNGEKSEVPSIDLADDYVELIDLYSKMSKENQIAIMQIMRNLK